MQKIVRMTFVTNDGDDKTIVVPESRVIAESSLDLQPGIAVEITVSDFGTVRVMLLDPIFLSSDFAGGAADTGIVTEQCRMCTTTIQGTVHDIDSGMRKHADLCFEMYMARLKDLELEIHCGGCDGSCGSVHEEVRLEETEN